MDLDDLEITDEAGPSAFTDYLHRLKERFGLDDVAYAGYNPVNGNRAGYMTYRSDWAEHYFRNRYFEIDPTLVEARRSIAPVDWTRLEKGPNFLKVFRDAADFGISSRGLTIPVRGPYGDVGGLSLSRNCSDREWDLLIPGIISQAQTVAVHLHDKVIHSDAMMKTLNAPALSSREREILQWTAAGKSQQDISDILSISQRTVEVHLRSARQKLCSLTTAQAVGRAVSHGLIQPR